MPSNGSYNNSASGLLIAGSPRDNWESRSRAKQAELQYMNIRQEQARQDANELEKNVQNQINTIQAIKALPAEAPDKPLINSFIEGQLKDAMTRIQKDYHGDARKFIETEGQFFTEQLKSNYLSSPVYARVEKNKMEMDMARKAMSDNQALIGDIDPQTGKYISAEEQIQKFRNGETPGYVFRGSYDPRKVNAYETFGKIYNPNGSKFERAAVPEEEKLAYSTSQLGDLAGTDYYFQSLRGKRMFYKSDPIEDRTLFNLDVSGKRMDMREQQSQINKNNASAAKDLAEANEQKQLEASKKTYHEKTFSTPLASVNVPSFSADNPNINKIIPGLGIPIKDLATVTPDGKMELNFKKYPNIEASELANESVGITESTIGGTKKFTGTLNGIMDITGLNGGTDYIDLSNMKHAVKKSDSYIYVDTREEEGRVSRKGGNVPDRAFKYYEVFVPKKEGIARGWPTDRIRRVKEADAAKKTPPLDGYILKGYVPVQDFVRDRNIDQYLSKKQQGQKQANETFDAQPAAPQIFQWDPLN